ncbi:hypothetical protein FHR55_002251 [Xanthomonas arboricola]
MNIAALYSHRWRNSHLSAGNTATLISGNDTNLKGAVLSANTVLADIGGDLNIESVQDTSTYASKDKAVGGSVALVPAPATAATRSTATSPASPSKAASRPAMAVSISAWAATPI